MKKILLVGFVFILLSVSVFAIPQTITVQGRLTTPSNEPMVGEYDFWFRLDDAISGTTFLWDNERTVNLDSNGVFNIVLGELGPVDDDFSGPRWLEICVKEGGAPSGDYSCLSPRVEVTSSGYAYTAQGADDFDVRGDIGFSGDLNPDGSVCSAGQVLKKSGSTWTCANDSSGISSCSSCDSRFINDAGDTMAGDLFIIDGNTKISKGSNNALKITTASGNWIELGPQNTDWAHIYTNLNKFAFNKKIDVIGNVDPYLNNNYDLGTNTRRWNQVYTTELCLSGTCKSAWPSGGTGGSGTVTSVATSGGLTGGTITTSGTISIATGGVTSAKIGSDAVTAAKIAANAVGTSEITAGSVGSSEIISSQVQERVSSSCASGSSIRAISSTGTVTCEPDTDTQRSCGSCDDTFVESQSPITGRTSEMIMDSGYLTADYSFTPSTQSCFSLNAMVDAGGMISLDGCRYQTKMVIQYKNTGMSDYNSDSATLDYSATVAMTKDIGSTADIDILNTGTVTIDVNNDKVTYMVSYTD